MPPKLLCAVISAVLLALVTRSGAAEEKPNIVLFLVDDLGLSDGGCFGSTYYRTPQIDRLAAEGMRFPQAYSACTVCSPTRAALMTGKSPAALHLTDWIPGHARPFAKLAVPKFELELPLTEATLPQALHAQGYVSAHFGKWHLGKAPATAHGFDISIGDNGLGQPASYFPPYKNAHLPDGPANEYLTDRLTDEAIKFVEANREKPFFLYLAHYAVHTPLGAKADRLAEDQARKDPANPHHNATYAAMVESVDDSVGRLRAKLEELHLTGRTIFIYTSDNGGLIGSTVNLGVRAGKGSAYEGGVRIPLLVSWPGVTKPGSECTVPVISNDLFSTALEAAGAPGGAGEGRSLVPALRGQELPSRPLFWHYPHYHPGGATPYSAVRDGDWKLIEFLEDGRRELYDLRHDPEEKHDLAATESARAGKLRQELEEWRVRVKAQMPEVNPSYDPAKEKAGLGKKEA